MKYILTSILVSFLFVKTLSAQGELEIYFVPALHNIHRVNQNYNYDSIHAVVKRLNPDVILVEIRPEDINQDTSYLKKFYPLEMWGMKLWFRHKTVLGFDWLGKEIEGKPIPVDYWKDKAEIKQWERALEQDSTMKIKILECETYLAERIPMLKEGTFEELSDGSDEKLCRDYYHCLERNLFNSPHERITEFYKLRNLKMAGNIIKAINQEGKGRYVVVTGADHVPFIKMYLFKEGLGGAIKK